MIGWTSSFLLKKIWRKNLFSLARTIGFSTEAPFGARKFPIFRNPENRGVKNSKNHGFSRFQQKWCQIRIFSYFSHYFETSSGLSQKIKFWPTITDLEFQFPGGGIPRNHVPPSRDGGSYRVPFRLRGCSSAGKRNFFNRFSLLES